MQGPPKGVFLHTGDWFWEPKNIMERSLWIPTISFNAVSKRSHLFRLNTLGSEEGEEKEKCQHKTKTCPVRFSKDKNSKAWTYLEFQRKLPKAGAVCLPRVIPGVYLHLLCKGLTPFLGEAARVCSWHFQTPPNPAVAAQTIPKYL